MTFVRRIHIKLVQASWGISATTKRFSELRLASKAMPCSHSSFALQQFGDALVASAQSSQGISANE